MMNDTNGWMHGWSNQGMLLWTAVGVVVAVLLIVLVRKQARK